MFDVHKSFARLRDHLLKQSHHLFYHPGRLALGHDYFNSGQLSSALNS